jgi:anti-sigma factor ChrR (cupin superfamily)
MRLEQDLTCAELVELVTRYFDGALESAERQRFEEHVVLCDGCARHLEQVRSTIAVVGDLTEDDLPVATQGALLDAFRGWKRR